MSRCVEGSVDGMVVTSGTVHADERGYFLELFNKDRIFGLPKFVQWNASYSLERTIRGFHIQHDRPQGKLVRVLQGNVASYGLDVRPQSPTFLKWSRVELRTGDAVYWPPGIAHALFVQWGPAYVVYGATQTYHAPSDGGIRWDCPELNVPLRTVLANLPEKMRPKVSDKDRALPGLSEYLLARGTKI